MASARLPVFPEEVTPLCPTLSVVKRGEQVLYLCPQGRTLRGHFADDVQGFLCVMSVFYANGYLRQVDIVRVFGVSASSLREAAKLYFEQGERGFYAPRPSGTCSESKPISLKAELRRRRLEVAKDTAEIAPFLKAGADALMDKRRKSKRKTGKSIPE